ncbi:lasso peptide biosynthesis B2 protein [Streptomyces sp. NPDC048643]|uniref:lasso peptide biosynthesis B2 protein n=1 Tax=Streptomyces sp. NPDC048643 TaxID=3155637 RepID=UPI0034168E3C
MTQLHKPEHVRVSASPHGGGVLLDVRSGHCFAMNPMAQALWQEWCRSGDFDAAVLLLARHHPAWSCDQLRRDARRLADELISRGLLVASVPKTTTGAARSQEHEVPARASSAHAAIPPQTPPTRTPERGSLSSPEGAALPAAGQKTMAASPIEAQDVRVAGAVFAVALGLLGLLAALLLIRLPMAAVFRTVSWTTRTWCRREATPLQATASLRAVRRATHLYPGRAACLELSLATIAVLAFAGRRAVWCIGTADDPYRFHAWVEAQGVPITSPGEYGHAEFRPVLSV